MHEPLNAQSYAPTSFVDSRSMDSDLTTNSIPPFDSLRINDSRTDFFAVYLREPGEFGRGYTGKCNEDSNTCIISVSHFILMPCANTELIVGNRPACAPLDSKLEPDPNETTAAYMRILIYTVNDSLFATLLTQETESTDGSGTAEVLLPTRAGTDSGSWIESRSSTSTSPLRAFR